MDYVFAVNGQTMRSYLSSRIRYFFQAIYDIDTGVLSCDIPEGIKECTDISNSWTEQISVDNLALDEHLRVVLKYNCIYTMYELAELNKRNQLEDLIGVGDLRLSQLKPIIKFYEDNSVEFNKQIVKNCNINELGLSARTTNCLKKQGINKLSELCNYTLDDIKDIEHLGRKSYDELMSMLDKHNIKLSPSNKSKFEWDYENIKRGLPLKYVTDILPDEEYILNERNGKLYINDVYVDTHKIGLLCISLGYIINNVYGKKFIKTSIRDLKVGLLYKLYPELTQANIKRYCKIHMSRPINTFTKRLYTSIIRLYKLSLLYDKYKFLDSHKYLDHIKDLFILDKQTSSSDKVVIPDLKNCTKHEVDKIMSECEENIFGTKITLDNVISDIDTFSPFIADMIREYKKQGKLRELIS